jgi:branched-chain amino acid transport system ATP-binding protein
MLRVSNLHAHYGAFHALKGVNYEIPDGEIVCLLGGNASGKSTTLRCVLGLVTPTDGHIEYEGERINGLRTSERVRRGIAAVPEGRRVFAPLTVMENLEMGAYARGPTCDLRTDLKRVFDLFPRLGERRSQLAGTLSGGEQQMLAMARALMARPRLLCMDEPSMGLAPGLVQVVFELIQRINAEGTTIFMVEQNAAMALSIAHRGYVLQTGEVVLSGPAGELLASDLVRRAYLGAT